MDNLKNNAIKIIGVFKIYRCAIEKTTAPRGFSVLSMRDGGSSTFSCCGKEYNVYPGNILYIKKGTEYSQSGENESIIAIHLETYEGELPGVELLNTGIGETGDYFRRIYRLWSNKEQGYYFKCMSELYSLFFELSRIENRKKTSDLVFRAKSKIKSEFSNPDFSVSEISGELNVSEVYLRRIFKRSSGITPHEYLLNVRMKKAEELLKSGYYNVSETASECGFSDAKYFGRLFKKKFNITPGRYSGMRSL